MLSLIIKTHYALRYSTLIVTWYAPNPKNESWHVAHDALVTRVRDVVCMVYLAPLAAPVSGVACLDAFKVHVCVCVCGRCAGWAGLGLRIRIGAYGFILCLWYLVDDDAM